MQPYGRTRDWQARHRARRGLQAAGLALVLVLVGMSCQPKNPKPPATTTTTTSTTTSTTLIPLPLDYSGAPSGPFVAFVGDSITRLAAANIGAWMQAGFRVNLQYKDGQNTEQMLPALTAQLANPLGTPVAVVVNLGTNDVMQQRGALWPASFDRMIGQLTGVPCVVLTTISTDPETYYNK